MLSRSMSMWSFDVVDIFDGNFKFELLDSCIRILCFVLVPYRDLPKYNPKRRSVISRALSDPRLNVSMTCLSGRFSRGPPSPCPSNRSLPPFSSASSCLSECSSHTRSESCSDSSYSGGSSHFGSEDNCGSAITGLIFIALLLLFILFIYFDIL